MGGFDGKTNACPWYVCGFIHEGCWNTTDIWLKQGVQRWLHQGGLAVQSVRGWHVSGLREQRGERGAGEHVRGVHRLREPGELREPVVHADPQSRVHGVQGVVQHRAVQAERVQRHGGPGVCELCDEVQRWLLQDGRVEVRWDHGLRFLPAGVREVQAARGLLARLLHLARRVCGQRDGVQPVPAVRGGPADRGLPAVPVSRRVLQLHEHDMRQLHAVPGGAVPGGGVALAGRGVPGMHELHRAGPGVPAAVHDVRRRGVQRLALQPERAVRDARRAGEQGETGVRLFRRGFDERVLRDVPAGIRVGRAVLPGLSPREHVQSDRRARVPRTVRERQAGRVRRRLHGRVRVVPGSVVCLDGAGHQPGGLAGPVHTGGGWRLRALLPVQRGVLQGVPLDGRGGVRGLRREPAEQRPAGPVGDGGPVDRGRPELPLGLQGGRGDAQRHQDRVHAAERACAGVRSEPSRMVEADLREWYHRAVRVRHDVRARDGPERDGLRGVSCCALGGREDLELGGLRLEVRGLRGGQAGRGVRGARLDLRWPARLHQEIRDRPRCQVRRHGVPVEQGRIQEDRVGGPAGGRGGGRWLGGCRDPTPVRTGAGRAGRELAAVRRERAAQRGGDGRGWDQHDEERGGPAVLGDAPDGGRVRLRDRRGVQPELPGVPEPVGHERASRQGAGRADRASWAARLSQRLPAGGAVRERAVRGERAVQKRHGGGVRAGPLELPGARGGPERPARRVPHAGVHGGRGRLDPGVRLVAQVCRRGCAGVAPEVLGAARGLAGVRGRGWAVAVPHGDAGAAGDGAGGRRRVRGGRPAGRGRWRVHGAAGVWRRHERDVARLGPAGSMPRRLDVRGRRGLHRGVPLAVERAGPDALREPDVGGVRGLHGAAVRVRGGVLVVRAGSG